MAQENSNSIQIDKMSVMMKEKIVAVENYDKQLQQIDGSLQNVKATLQATPGVNGVITAVDQAIRDNWARGMKVKQVEATEGKILQQMYELYNSFAQEVEQLPTIHEAQSQLKLGLGNQNANSDSQTTNNQTNVPNGQFNNVPNGQFTPQNNK